MLSRLKIFLQYALPKRLITELAGWIANQRLGVVTTYLIKMFMKYYGVNMREAWDPHPESYPTFNSFFTRKLSNNARPFTRSNTDIIMPADGILSEFGMIEKETLIQAKGHKYTLGSLLGGNSLFTNMFKEGSYATIYLSPKDYHRVHMPCDGKLREMIYIPGTLFSVNQLTTAHIPNIFARNERVICYFETEFGPLIQILIGAIIVGSIETPWHGVVIPPREGVVKRWVYENTELQQGEEMGCFRLGSTVITLFTSQSMVFESNLVKGNTARLGNILGQRI